METTGTLDIICRFWALKGRETGSASNPRFVELPSWIQFVEDSAWGKGDDVFNGRKLGDSFVGLPDNHHNHASGRLLGYKQAKVVFPEVPALQITPVAHDLTNIVLAMLPNTSQDTSVQVGGVVIGLVDYRTDPFSEGIVPQACLEKLGFPFDPYTKDIAKVPDQLWRTLVADRGPNGLDPPPWYKIACRNCLARRSNNGHINIDKVLSTEISTQRSMRQYLERVRAVTWNRSFIEGRPTCGCGAGQCAEAHDQLVGFGPPMTKEGDVIVVIYGCSVPVI